MRLISTYRKIPRLSIRMILVFSLFHLGIKLAVYNAISILPFSCEVWVLYHRHIKQWEVSCWCCLRKNIKYPFVLPQSCSLMNPQRLSTDINYSEQGIDHLPKKIFYEEPESGKRMEHVPRHIRFKETFIGPTFSLSSVSCQNRKERDRLGVLDMPCIWNNASN